MRAPCGAAAATTPPSRGYHLLSLFLCAPFGQAL